MTSDGSDTEDTGADQQDAAVQDGTSAGGDQQPDVWDKVADVLQETAGVDIRAEFKRREEVAAAEAARDAGRNAQQTYDPKIDALQKQLRGASEELEKARRDTRLADIAKMPPEKQEEARKIFEAEETVRGLGQMKEQLNVAAKAITAERMVLDLTKRGIAAEAEDFLSCDTPQDMEAKAADLRAEHAERQLEEARAGKDTKEPDKKSDRQPPAASQRAAPKKAATGGAAGQKPWEEQKGKGLSKLADALRAQREAM